VAPVIPTEGVECSLCHNNSLTVITETDGFGITNPQSARSSHYLKDANANLMTTAIHSNNCTWCHFTNTNNASWGTPADPRVNFSSLHTGKVNNDCYICHGGLTFSVKLHDSGITSGASGGVNCTNCHNIGGSNNNVNFTALNKSIHATLNSEATSATWNASNEPCWACHGTLNGTYANESDQPASGHNTTVYKNPRNCNDCHITGSLKFTTKNVTDHIQEGFTALTDVMTSSYCSICHNNSVNNGYEPDAMGVGGLNPMNASVSHYGSNARLVETVGNSNTSQGCIYCHYDTGNAARLGKRPRPQDKHRETAW